MSEVSETPPKLTKHNDRPYLTERNEIIRDNIQSNIKIKASENSNGNDLPKETGGLSLAEEIVKELNDVKSLFEKKRTDSTVSKKVRS